MAQLVRRISPGFKILSIALIVGVIIPYGSYRLRMDDPCMPEQAGLAYFPIISPLGDGCPGALMGELGLYTVGIPSVLAGLAISLLVSPPTNWMAYLSDDRFCIPPLVLSFMGYFALATVVRRITSVEAKKEQLK